MANRQGISVSNSRFACLKIEDDEEEERKTQVNATPQQASTNAAKKKNKKKKEHKENEQLKNLAFRKGGSGVTGKHQHSHQNGTGDGGDEKNTWNQWKEHDNELVEEQFKDDLASALLQSRLESEKQKQESVKLKERIEAGVDVPSTREGRKKKKQREKPQPMSLEQFKQLPPEKPANESDDSDEGSVPTNLSPLQNHVPLEQQDPKFFSSVKDDAEHILRHEKIQEDYRKHYASDNAIMAKLKNDLETKDQQICELKSRMEAMEAELKQVKKRNKQLCVILAQGEMKDKAQVLLQVEELTIVRDELTEQVTSLTGELEKEKSKNRALKAENDKLKGSKHGK